MSLNERLFVIVPLAAMLCNLFLFMTFLTAKKTKLVKSFMMLLVAFMLWTLGFATYETWSISGCTILV